VHRQDWDGGVGEVAGHVRVEDVLDRLFAGFCIGK
jgi:tRNA modification GTPase